MTKLTAIVERSIDPILLPGGEWDKLLSQSGQNTIFLRAGWLRADLAIFGENESPYIATVRDGDGALLAACAFLNRRGRFVFLGTGHADYLDFVTRASFDDETKRQYIAAMLNSLKSAAPKCRGFELRNVRQWDVQENHSPALAAPWKAVTLRQYSAPAMSMTAAPDAVRKKSLKRHENGLAKLGAITCETFSRTDEIEPKLNEFFDQHIRRWSKTPFPSLFAEQCNQDFYRRLARELDADRVLRFTEVRLDGRLVAAHFGFFYDGVFTWYKPTYEPELAEHSPGEVLLKKLIERAMQEGAREFDFTIGDEAFKSRFATELRTVADQYVTDSSLSFAAVQSRLSARRAMKSLLTRVGVWEKLKRLAGKQ